MDQDPATDPYHVHARGEAFLCLWVIFPSWIRIRIHGTGFAIFTFLRQNFFLDPVVLNLMLLLFTFGSVVLGTYRYLLHKRVAYRSVVLSVFFAGSGFGPDSDPAVFAIRIPNP